MKERKKKEMEKLSYCHGCQGLAGSLKRAWQRQMRRKKSQIAQSGNSILRNVGLTRIWQFWWIFFFSFSFSFLCFTQCFSGHWQQSSNELRSIRMNLYGFGLFLFYCFFLKKKKNKKVSVSFFGLQSIRHLFLSTIEYQHFLYKKNYYFFQKKKKKKKKKE